MVTVKKSKIRDSNIKKIMKRKLKKHSAKKIISKDGKVDPGTQSISEVVEAEGDKVSEIVTSKKNKIDETGIKKVKKRKYRRQSAVKDTNSKDDEVDLPNSKGKEVVEDSGGDEDSDEDDADSTLATEEASAKHQEYLRKLKEDDPEFYKFLQEQDADLLEFHPSDDEIDDEEHDDDVGDDEEMEAGEKRHTETVRRIPKAHKDSSGRLIFDGRMLEYLQSVLDLEDQKQRINIDDIRFAVEAFNACVSRVGADVDVPVYVINEQKMFYETVRLCFERLGEAFLTLITGSAQVKTESGDMEESKRRKLKNIKKYQTPLRQYLTSILKFANEIQTPDVIISTLRAIRHLVDLYAHFKKITKSLFKVLVRIWSRKTLDCRVGAYVCMMQLVKSHPEHFVCLYKCCYLGFVTNSRDVSTESWPLLQFMHRTFAELTVLHPNLAYPYAFVYIRQIGIHLRNAIISKKRKDMVQTMYNWQMVQCLYMWTRVVSKAHAVHDCEAICELTYPLTQLIVGVLKLYQSLRYIPLRLHCISLLIQLQANCGVYVPTLALAVELFGDAERILAKKPKAKLAKIVDLECSLKVGCPVLEEISFRNALCDHLFRITLQAAHLICGQPSFPDVMVPITFRIRKFLQKIRSVEFARRFRSLLEKLEEHAKFIADVLLVKEFNICDDVQVLSLKLDLNKPDSPLRAFYRQWENAWRLKQKLLTKSSNEETTKEVKKDQLSKKKENKKEKESKVVQKPKKRKRLSNPASENADGTIPDQFRDLTSWSDSD